MSMHELDRRLLLAAESKDTQVPAPTAAAFFSSLLKLAEEPMPAQPDVSGEVSGPFAVPLPQVVELIAQMISNEFKTQAYYLYYASMLRGLNREGVAEEFEEHAADELKHAQYLLRRLGVLSPGGVPIPPYPPPEPMTSADEIVRAMIVVEQIGLSLWKQLHAVMGDNPMKYTIEQFLQAEEEHEDELWQFVDPTSPTAQADEAAAAPQPQQQPEQAAPAEAKPSPASEIITTVKEHRKEAKARLKAASLALTRRELLAAGMDPSYAGKKEHGNHEDPLAPWHGTSTKQAGVIFGRSVDPTIMGSHAQQGMEADIRHGMPTGYSVAVHSDPILGGLLGRRVKGYSTAPSGTNREALRARWEQSRAAQPKTAADLTASSRAEIKDTNFVFPKERRYPIHDKDHALAALGMVAMHGTPDEKSAVRAAVDKKYPGLQVKKAGDDLATTIVEGMFGIASAATPAITEHFLKSWAKTPPSSATMKLRQQTDLGLRKDQYRTEIKPVSPEKLLHEKAHFGVSHTPAVTHHHAPENHTPVPMRGALPMMPSQKRASLGDFISKLADGIMVPAPGADSPEAYVAREQQLATQQAQAEAAHSKTISMQASQAAQQAQAQAQAAQQQLQEAQAQLEQMQMQSQQASQQAIQAQQQAAEAEARAAQHSISKMQLGMRVNQMRQELANFVMQDPVSENAATVSDLAAQGQPATPDQQAQADAAAQQQAMTGEAPQPSAETQDSQAEADRAKGDAQEQQAQADQSAQQDQAKAEQKGQGGGGGAGTHVTVKTSGVADFIGGKARALGDLVGHAGEQFLHGVGGRSPGMGANAAHAGHEFVRGAVDETGRVLKGMGTSALEAVKSHPLHVAAGVVGAGGMAAAPVVAIGRQVHKSNERQERMAKALEAMAAKTAAPADRRLMNAIFEGPSDTLGQALRGIAHQHMPGEAAQAAVGKSVRDALSQGAEAVTEGAPTLWEKVRPHAPGFAAGMGTAILGSSLLGGGGGQQQMQQPALSYAQYYGQ